MCAQLLQSCPTLCDPMDCSPPGSSLHGILQARILELVAMSTSRGSSRPRNQTCSSCIADWFFTAEPPQKTQRYLYWHLIGRHQGCCKTSYNTRKPLPTLTQTSPVPKVQRAKVEWPCLSHVSSPTYFHPQPPRQRLLGACALTLFTVPRWHSVDSTEWRNAVR